MTQLSLNLTHHTVGDRQFSIETSRLPAKDSRYAMLCKKLSGGLFKTVWWF